MQRPGPDFVVQAIMAAIIRGADAERALVRVEHGSVLEGVEMTRKQKLQL